MNNKERKLVLTLAKGLVHQLEINQILMDNLPSEISQAVKTHQDRLEGEIAEFIKLVQEEWNQDDET